MNIKGLELQETSCHTREAQHIDDIFALAFENPDGSSANSSSHNKLLALNPSLFTCMQPLDVLVFNGYSDAKNSLVGILDSPETIQTIYEFFPKVLHYFLVQKLAGEAMLGVAANESHEIDMESSVGELVPEEIEYAKSKTPSANSSKINSEEERELAKFEKSILNNSLLSEDSFVRTGKELKEDSVSNWSDSSSGEDDEQTSKKRNKKFSTLSSKVAPKIKDNSALQRKSYDYDFDEILGAMNMESKQQLEVRVASIEKQMSKDTFTDLKIGEKERKSFRNPELELSPMQKKVSAPVRDR